MLASFLSMLWLAVAGLAQPAPDLDELDRQLEGQEPLFAYDGESFTNPSRTRTSSY